MRQPPRTCRLSRAARGFSLLCMIHPSAVISPEAQLAADVEVGPFVCIDGPVKIGAGCRIESHAVITGDVVMGAGNVIGHHAVIGAPPQDLSYKMGTPTGVRIGEGNTLREFATIHRGTKAGTMTVVGDRNFLMAGAHLAHNVTLGSDAVLANNVLLGGHVTVADRVFIGGCSVFHQFVRIGRFVIAQGLSGASKDIPPFTLTAGINRVAGLNVIGLRRGGFDAEQRARIKRAFDLLYRSGLNTSQALEKARGMDLGPEGAEFFEFVAGAKKRGICGFVRSAKRADDGE
jgi:UDP-N-acetylglucosamine acyltransferase